MTLYASGLWPARSPHVITSKCSCPWTSRQLDQKQHLRRIKQQQATNQADEGLTPQHQPCHLPATPTNREWSPTEALNSSGLRGEPSLSSPAVPIPAPPLIKEFQLRGVLPHGETFASKLRESPTDSRISCQIQRPLQPARVPLHSAPLTRNSHLSTRIINQPNQPSM